MTEAGRRNSGLSAACAAPKGSDTFGRRPPSKGRERIDCQPTPESREAAPEVRRTPGPVIGRLVMVEPGRWTRIAAARLDRKGPTLSQDRGSPSDSKLSASPASAGHLFAGGPVISTPGLRCRQATGRPVRRWSRRRGKSAWWLRPCPDTHVPIPGIMPCRPLLSVERQGLYGDRRTGDHRPRLNIRGPN